jgi:hypothetical protein
VRERALEDRSARAGEFLEHVVRRNQNCSISSAPRRVALLPNSTLAQRDYPGGPTGCQEDSSPTNTVATATEPTSLSPVASPSPREPRPARPYSRVATSFNRLPRVGNRRLRLGYPRRIGKASRVVCGVSNKRIASELDLTEQTAKDSINAIIHHRAEPGSFAIAVAGGTTRALLQRLK